MGPRGYDRDVKLPLYARAGIPEVWLVDLPGEGIERRADPDQDAGTYRGVVRFRRGDTIRSHSLPELVIPLDAVLGRASQETGPEST